MNLHRFTVVTRNETQQADESTNILINLEQIVSVKPIKMIASDKQIIDGYWIRLTNGKKYKASRVPAIIKEAFNEDIPVLNVNDSTTHEVEVNLQ